MKDGVRKSIPEKTAQATPAPSVESPRELTCTEGQIEDLLADGETTEPEGDSDDADDSSERVATDAGERKSLTRTPSSRTQR